jgi:hypothetical protein
MQLRWRWFVIPVALVVAVVFAAVSTSAPRSHTPAKQPARVLSSHPHQ